MAIATSTMKRLDGAELRADREEHAVPDDEPPKIRTEFTRVAAEQPVAVAAGERDHEQRGEVGEREHPAALVRVEVVGLVEEEAEAHRHAHEREPEHADPEDEVAEALDLAQARRRRAEAHRRVVRGVEEPPEDASCSLRPRSGSRSEEQRRSRRSPRGSRPRPSPSASLRPRRPSPRPRRRRTVRRTSPAGRPRFSIANIRVRTPIGYWSAISAGEIGMRAEPPNPAPARATAICRPVGDQRR